MKKYLLLTLSVLCSLVCGTLRAGGNPEDISALRDLLLPIKSLSANFQQQVLDAEGFQLQTANGEFVVAQPGKLRWISRSPMEQWVVSDGQSLWVYDPDLEQVTIQPFNSDLAATPAALFSGDLEMLDATYFVTRETAGANTLFRLLPERAGGLFNQIELTFHHRQPLKMVLRDSLEQTTSISFADVQINPAVNAGQFVFQIPQGVDVIRND